MTTTTMHRNWYAMKPNHCRSKSTRNSQCYITNNEFRVFISVKQAFPITKKLPQRDGPPTTAEEYISLIRQESNKLPSVLSAPRTNPPINTSPPKKSRKSPCPSLLTEVSSAELHRLANQFADLQQSFLQMCRRKDLPQKAFSPQQLLKMQPLVSIVMQVDHVSSVAALKFITESLPQQEEREHKERNVESMSKLASALVADRHRATWMFCLLLVLEMYVVAGAQIENSFHIARVLTLFCSQILSGIQANFCRCSCNDAMSVAQSLRFTSWISMIFFLLVI